MRVDEVLESHGLLKAKVVQEASGPAKVHGFRFNVTERASYTPVEYIEDSVEFMPATSYNNVFHYGDWKNEFPFNMIRPCLFKNGVFVEYLNRNDYNYYTNGAPVDIDSGINGDVMIEIPKIYWKMENVNNVISVRLSQEKKDASYECLAHKRGTVEKDYLYVAAYFTSKNSGVAGSLSNKDPFIDTMNNMRTLVKAKGAGYDMMGFYQLTLIQMLFVLMFKHRNSQEALGTSTVIDGTRYPIVKTGVVDDKGIYYGDKSEVLPVKFLGLEGIYGNIPQWLDGIYYAGTTSTTPSYYIANQNFNADRTNYTQVLTSTATSDAYGYLSAVQGTQELGFLPKTLAGSNNTFFADYARLKYNSHAIFGGGRSADFATGIFYMDFSRTNTDTHGSRIMYL